MATTAAASRPAAASMSLSRRLLSLPQELTGCSLPPQVSGRRYGVVTLCVAHILESAVSSHPLPRVSLVRVRWWGEETAGSLFRPVLLSADGLGFDQNAQEPEGTPRRAITMKYQVRVQPEQLLGYFQDMGNLILEVIDRDTRKKVGECSLRMDIQASNSVMTAQEKLVALRRQDELCEIRPTAQDAQDGEVLGYLAVTFDVQWTDVEEEMDVGSEFGVEKVADVKNVGEGGDELSAASKSVPLKKVWIDAEKVREEVDLISGKVEEQVRNDTKIGEEGVASASSGDFQRIQKLLEKGNALKRSMERAVAEKDVVGNEVDSVDEAPGLISDADLATKQLLSFGTDADFTPSTPKWNVSQTLESVESDFLASSISSRPSEVSKRQTKEIDTKSGQSPAKAMLEKLQREVKTPTQPEEAWKSFSVPDMHGCESLQFAIMFEEVSNVRISAIEHAASDEGNPGNGANIELASISLHYTVPSRFTTVSPAARDMFNRTVARKTRRSRWLDSESSLRADFIGHIHVFQSSFAEDTSEYLYTGCLIIEVWLNFRNAAERTLLGLSKVPLRKLAELFRGDTYMLSMMERPLPFVGVDDRLVIENPFTGKSAGYLRARVAVGTAEQLLAWATTARTIVKLQAVIRGHLLRKHLRESRTVFPLSELEFRDAAFSSRAMDLLSDETPSGSRSTAPTISTALQRCQDLSLDDNCSRGDDSEKRSENVSKDLPLFETNSASWLALRKIRFDVRECWRSTVQQTDQAGEKQPQRARHAAPVLGCELQGQLVLSGGGASKGLSFALWWDAADRRLNSAFAHTFRAAGVGADLPLVGPQSQVLFALHVENGFFGTQSRETIMGEARLNLYETFHKRRTMGNPAGNLEAEESSVDMDAPIEWDSVGREHQGLPSVIPLKISYHVVPLVMRSEEAADSRSDVLSYYGSAYAGDQRLGSITTSHYVQTPFISAEEIDERLMQESRELRDHESEVMHGSPFASSDEAIGSDDEEYTGRWADESDKSEQHGNGSASTCALASSSPRLCASLEEPNSDSAADVADSAEKASDVSSTDEVGSGSDDGSPVRGHGEVELFANSSSPKESEIDATSGVTAVHGSENDEGFVDTFPVDGTSDSRSDHDATQDLAPSTQKAANSNEGGNERDVTTVIYTAGDGGLNRAGHDESLVVATSGDAVRIMTETQNKRRLSMATAGNADDEDQGRHDATMDVKTSDDESVSQSQYSTNSDIPASESVESDDGSGKQSEHGAGLDLEMLGNAAICDDQSHNGADLVAAASDNDADDVGGFNPSRHCASSVVSTSGDFTNDSEGASQSKHDASLDVVMSNSATRDADEAGQSQSERCSTVPATLISGSEDDTAGTGGHDEISGMASPDKTAGAAGLSSSEDGLDSCASTEENAAADDNDDGIGAFETDVAEDLPGEVLASSSESVSVTSMHQEIPQALDNSTPSSTVGISIDDVCVKDSEASFCATEAASGEGTLSNPDKSDEQQQVQQDTRSIGLQVVQYADKATQVDPSELEIVSKCSISTTSADPLNISNDTSLLINDVASLDQHDEHREQSTVDVGCDPITVASVSSSGEINPDETIQTSPPSDCQDVQTENDNNFQARVDNPVDTEVSELRGLPSEQAGSLEQPPSNVQSYPLSQDSSSVPSQSGPRIELIHSAPHAKKLDLVYEMLREMRDSYFSKPLPEVLTQGEPLERDSDLEEQTKTMPELSKTMKLKHETISEKRCSCPNSPLSRDTSSVRSQMTSLELKFSAEKLERGFQGTTRTTNPNMLELNGLKSPQQSQRFQTTALAFDGKSSSVLSASLRTNDGKDNYRAAGANHRFASSHSSVSKRLDGGACTSRLEKKDDHSSVHSLFARDSETERIARIMQGSMNYWMKDDSSSSCNDDVSDEEETDDDCYF